MKWNSHVKCAVLVITWWKENQDPRCWACYQICIHTNVFLGLRLCQKLGGDFLGRCFPVKIYCQKAGLLLHPNIHCFILYWLFKYLCAFRSSNFICLTEKCCIWQWLWANNTQDVWTALCSVFLCPSNLDYVFVNLFDHSAHENYKLTSVSRS